MPSHTFNGPEYWGESEEQLWEHISRGFGGLENDDVAARMFSAGWVEEAPSAQMRTAVRDAFFDWAIEHNYFDDRTDFDWAEWREYMGYSDT